MQLGNEMFLARMCIECNRVYLGEVCPDCGSKSYSEVDLDPKDFQEQFGGPMPGNSLEDYLDANP